VKGKKYCNQKCDQLSIFIISAREALSPPTRTMGPVRIDRKGGERLFGCAKLTRKKKKQEKRVLMLSRAINPGPNVFSISTADLLLPRILFRVIQ